MGLIALGVNHQTASLPLREKLAFAAGELAGALQAGRHALHSDDFIILSTCNRTEIYALNQTADAMTDWLAQNRRISRQELEGHLYQHHEQQALQHLIRVASGLDSMVLGEPQILGQLKAAWQVAQDNGLRQSGLGRLFEQVFAAAKQVRTETAIGVQPVTMGFAVVELIHQVFSQIGRLTGLLIASGEMNELIGRHLVTQGIGRLLIINRTLSHAQALAERLRLIRPDVVIEVQPWDQLDHSLPQADVVSSCTGSASLILTESQIRRALRQRRHESMLLIDLAVPRDIDPAVSRIDEAYLYAVDDLQQVIAGNQAQRQQAAVEAEVLAANLAAQLMQQGRAQQAGPLIQQYRMQAQQVAQEEQARALQLLAQGMPAEQVLARLTQSLTGKLTHRPSVLLRAAAEEEGQPKLRWLTDQLQLAEAAGVLHKHD